MLPKRKGEAGTVIEYIRIVVPETLLTDARFSPMERLIGAFIFSHPDKINYTEIINAFQVSKNTVTKALDGYEKAGVLTRLSRTGGWRLSDAYSEVSNPKNWDTNPKKWDSKPQPDKETKESTKERKENIHHHQVKSLSIYKKDLKEKDNVELPVLKDNLKDIDTIVEKEQGAASPRPEDGEPPRSREISEIVAYLNERTGKRFSAKCRQTREHINARMDEGYGIADFKGVIDRKVSEWRGSKMEKYLRPETLFCSKFDRYVNEAPAVAAESENAETDALWNAMWEAAHT